jgi:hypothetical protein
MSGLVAYPFPLRPDCWAHLRLPNDFSRDDRDRLVAFLLTLVEPVSADAVDPHAARTGNPSTREQSS